MILLATIGDIMKEGDIVFFTQHYAEWIKLLKGDLDISLIHRIAKIVKIFNWDTEEGKMLLEQRVLTGKWNNLESKDFKFVLDVYYPDLVNGKKKQLGIKAIEVLPALFPGTEFPLFVVYPQHLLDDMFKKIDHDIFKLEKKRS